MPLYWSKILDQSIWTMFAFIYKKNFSIIWGKIYAQGSRYKTSWFAWISSRDTQEKECKSQLFNMLLLVERFIFRLHFSSKVQINVKYTNDLYLEWNILWCYLKVVLMQKVDNTYVGGLAGLECSQMNM